MTQQAILNHVNGTAVGSNHNPKLLISFQNTTNAQSEPDTEFEAICDELCSKVDGLMHWDIRENLDGKSESTLEFVIEALAGGA